MEALDIARWQFGITTVYHFIFVPLTIGLSLMVAMMQTIALRSKDPARKDAWIRMTKFFGSMLIVNFGIGIATGIVQEFQFGLNWSEYARYVGDVFGAPLALEGLAAFFLESVFLGLWIFGWGRMPERIHLLTIWAVALGTTLSAYFIIAANSFMQHPVGAMLNPETGRAELDPSQGSILSVLTNITTLAAFPHVVSGAWLVAAAFVTGIAAWHMVRHHRRADELGRDTAEGADHDHAARQLFRPVLRFGVVAMFVSALVLVVSGDFQAKLMFEQQPMKMASAEALCTTQESAPFSILAVGGPDAFSTDCSGVTHLIEIPYVTAILATNDPGATLQGVDDLNAQYKEQFGETVTDIHGQEVAADYRPNLFVTYWSFRLMMGLAAFSGVLALWALWVTRGRGENARTTGSRAFQWFAVLAIPMPFLANSAGWVFTEMGRQPWVVHPNPDDPTVRLMTMQAVSSHPAWMVATSLIAFTLVYGVLAVIWFQMMRKAALKGVPLPQRDPETDELDTPTLAFDY
ncbi:cytochrome ubiquinol oxidase subunit I [Brachybacterium saurashtrense]|uniref:Cytochrome ubiquinol oxidase subunit I n=1 Tax=Brachybacterium saurashtrense TaxID=556288 RepID=A0A345YN13_9MICO|nr:cytochrome ubiquinol oxidase subunit I [Brachybacterium saurashtrense]AXK45315.1 cytochrome ubiquinol oxidase subunit I [Brachybacterium saurashtrense]RRR21928.1 cytochrome ubiquinol oxidase subunit I [Brachybacterium saurashtrense]